MTEPVLTPPEPLLAQFSERAVFTLTDDEDDRLSATYWLATPMVDEQETEVDMVSQVSPCVGVIVGDMYGGMATP